jgi:hypothetical protein
MISARARPGLEMRSSSSVGTDGRACPPLLVVQTASGPTYPTLAEESPLAGGIAPGESGLLA